MFLYRLRTIVSAVFLVIGLVLAFGQTSIAEAQEGECLIAFSFPNEGGQQLRIKDMQDGEILFQMTGARELVWSPDGQKLAVTVDGSVKIVQRHFGFEQTPSFVAKTVAERATLPAWNGNQITYQRPPQILKFGGGGVVLKDGVSGNHAWSANGQLAYQVTDGRKTRLYVDDRLISEQNQPMDARGFTATGFVYWDQGTLVEIDPATGEVIGDRIEIPDSNPDGKNFAIDANGTLLAYHNGNQVWTVTLGEKKTVKLAQELNQEQRQIIEVGWYGNQPYFIVQDWSSGSESNEAILLHADGSIETLARVNMSFFTGFAVNPNCETD